MRNLLIEIRYEPSDLHDRKSSSNNQPRFSAAKNEKKSDLDISSTRRPALPAALIE